MTIWTIGLATLMVGFIVGFALGWICAFRVITQFMEQ
jgi:hypothetical protein